MTTGKELRLKRIAMDVRTGDLAERLGVSSARISRWETLGAVREKDLVRYLEALATFGTVPTVRVETPTEDAA